LGLAMGAAGATLGALVLAGRLERL
jgi:hypothetical protein